MLPIRIIDIVLSTVAALICLYCTYIMYKIYKKSKEVIFIRYLFFTSVALSVFSLSRGGGHILKNALFFTGKDHAWSLISSYTGATNTLVFVVLGIIFLLSLDVKRLMRQFVEIKSREKAALKNAVFKTSILNAMEYPAVVIDHEYKIIEANRAFYHEFGVPIEETGNVHCYEVLHGYDNPCFVFGETCLLNRIFRETISAKTIHRHTTPKGNRIHHVVYTPVLQENGSRQVLEVIRDITDEIALERQTRQRLREIYELRQTAATRSLVSGVAHEFNNILMGIMGHAEILTTKASGIEQLQPHLKAIIASAEKAAGFVRQMLLYSKEGPLKTEEFDLGEFLDRFVSIVQLPENIKLKYEREQQPMSVRADKDSLAESLTHLINNSLDAMPEGGIITISLYIKNIKGRDMALLTIRDTGHGIPPQIIDRVFDPFFTTKDVGKGTGLGLSLVKGVIEVHKGSIEIQSTPGHGTEITIALPII